MKTKVISVNKVNNTSVLNFSVIELSNFRSLTICTQKDDLSSFYSDNYMDESWDMGWFDGSSYISCRYSFGSHSDIEKVREIIVNKSIELEMDEEQCLELFVLVFDVGDGNSLLVSNIEEHLYYHDIDEELFENVENVIHMIGGSVTDDSDIGNTICMCLISHPKTKSFKVPEDENYVSNTEDEILSWNDYVEYIGYSFSDTKELKKGEKYFDMFKAAQRLVLSNTELFPDRTDENMIDIIFKNLDFINNIPDSVQLEYKHGTSNKFYNIELNDGVCEVNIEYGAIGKTANTDGKEFETIDLAKAFYEKTVISKIKSGYRPK